MRKTQSSALATALAAVALLPLGVAARANAQNATAAPPPPAGAQQAAANVTGTVKLFTLTPVGDVDGVILTDGTEVHTPPHLSRQMTAAVRPGDQVRIQGWPAITPGVVVATTVTDTRNGQSVVDQGPPPPGAMPPPPPPGSPAPDAQAGAVQGQVQKVLHGPAGDVNGALLADGTQIRLPPPAAYQVATVLQPGQPVTAQGFVLSTANGRVVDV